MGAMVHVYGAEWERDHVIFQFNTPCPSLLNYVHRQMIISFNGCYGSAFRPEFAHIRISCTFQEFIRSDTTVLDRCFYTSYTIPASGSTISFHPSLYRDQPTRYSQTIPIHFIY